MTNEELAKKLLSGEINSDFLWIYAISEHGYIRKDMDEKIALRAAEEGYNCVRFLRPNTMMTQDIRNDRINIILDTYDNITRIEVF